MVKGLSGSARREVVVAVRARYRIRARSVKREILREFAAITVYHRESAIRILNGDDDERALVVLRLFSLAERQTFLRDPKPVQSLIRLSSPTFRSKPSICSASRSTHSSAERTPEIHAKLMSAMRRMHGARQRTQILALQQAQHRMHLHKFPIATGALTPRGRCAPG